MARAADQELYVQGHKLVALGLNPHTPGPPIVLLHGITASARFWTLGSLSSPFTSYGPCTSLSLPGHYPAAFPRGFRAQDLTAETIARVLAAAISQLTGEQPAILVGHSTGGFAALAIAAHVPGVARGVVSIAGFVQGRWTGMLGMYQRLARGGFWGRVRFRALLGAGQVSRGLYRYAGRYLVADPTRLHADPGFDDLIRHAFVDYRHLNLGAMLDYFAVMPNVDIESLLSRISIPTLVLAGDRDPIVPLAQSRLIAGQIPDAELATLPGAGHWPFIEASAAYRQALDGWLQRQQADG